MDRKSQLEAVIIAFLILDCITVSLRCFVRIHLVKSFGIDDWFMVLSFATFAALAGVVLASTHYGLGQHLTDLSPVQIVQATKYLIIGELIYIADSAFVKISIGLLITRIASKPVYKYILYTSIALTAVWTLAIFLAVAFQCIPLSLAWDPTSGSGHCMAAITITRLGYGLSALDIGCDWLYAIIPIPMLWHVQMHWRLKASVCFVLSLGTIASTATIVRLKYLIALTDQTDVLFAISVTQMWTILELGLGMTAGSVAALRPLMRYVSAVGFSSAKDGRPSDYGPSQELGYIKQNESRSQSHTTRVEALDQDNDSQTEILNQNAIQKRLDVDVYRS